MEQYLEKLVWIVMVQVKKWQIVQVVQGGGTGSGEKEVTVTCPVCNGNKTVNSGSMCGTCGGSGSIRKTRTCTSCNGTGKVGNFESSRIVRTANASINRNLAKNKDDDGDGTNEQSSEFVRMKDLVISGYVWLRHLTYLWIPGLPAKQSICMPPIVCHSGY